MNELRAFDYKGVKQLASNNSPTEFYGELIDGKFNKFVFMIIQVFTCEDKMKE